MRLGRLQGLTFGGRRLHAQLEAVPVALLPQASAIQDGHVCLTAQQLI